MKTLKITIELETDEDYDGIEETTKTLTACLNGRALPESIIYEEEKTDTECKELFKSYLNSIGYAWDVVE